MGPGLRVRRAVAAAATSLALVVLAACSTPAGSGDTGYRSQDGATTTWTPDERSAPLELSGTDVDGAPQDVASWRGDVVLVNTWYAACPPCRAEAADLVALADDYADRGLHVLGVNSTDAAGTAAAFAREFSVTYPSILDAHSGKAQLAFSKNIRPNATPTTLVLDTQGRVASRIEGAITDQPGTLDSLIDTALAEAGS